MNVGLVFLILDLAAALAVLVWALTPHRPASWRGRWHTSSRRAQALLCQLLGEEEYGALVRRGYLDVPSPAIAERVYRIPCGTGRVEVIEQGILIASLCVVANSWISDADMVLTHKLLIEGDEARYLRIANRFPPGSAPRLGTWQP